MIKYLFIFFIIFDAIATEKIKDNVLKVGKSNGNDVYIYADNGNTNLPFIYFDFSDSQWKFSKDGLNSISLDDKNSNLSLASNAQITLDTEVKKQVISVQSSSGAVTLNSLPFSNTPKNGSEIVLVGLSDTNTVTFLFNDVSSGLLINGHATLEKGFTLTLIYNEELSRFIEISRSF